MAPAEEEVGMVLGDLIADDSMLPDFSVRLKIDYQPIVIYAWTIIMVGA